jgi:heme-degrading monooxygenase HmoA
LERRRTMNGRVVDAGGHGRSPVMILEAAFLDVKPGREGEFERAFAEASPIIASAAGYLRHSLSRCVERPSKYLLLVEWRTQEDHMHGFRGSPRYQEWKRLLHHFYDPFPTVEHFSRIGSDSSVGV